MAIYHRESFEAKCRSVIEGVVGFFTVDNGRISIQTESSISAILGRCLDEFSTAFEGLEILGEPASRDKIIAAIYDGSSLPLTSGESSEITSLLDPQEKARLLVEGVAGVVALARDCVQRGVDITPAILAREMRRFSASPERTHMLQRVEKSHLFSDCLMKGQILDLIIDASHETDPVTCDSPVSTSPPVTWEDYNVDPFGSTYARPSRNMGLPWGFTIMALN